MQPGQDSKPRVCRRLFADEPQETDTDGVRDNVLNQISEQINRDLDEASRKYNFDFRSETPLEGDWEWERIGEQPPGDQELVQTPAETPAEPTPLAPTQDPSKTEGL